MKNIRTSYDFTGQKYIQTREHHGNKTIVRNYEVH